MLMAPTKLTAAVVGCGAISNVHINAIRLADALLVAVCDIDPEKIKEKDSAYTDYIEMLDKAKPQVVHILTPHYLHAQMCIEALKRNIHVLVEKPPAMTKTQFTELKLAAESSKAKLAVCFQNRLNAGVIEAQRILADGKLGKIKGALGLVSWDRDNAYYQSGAWRGTMAQEGGGVLINQAIHTLDLMTLLLGRPQSVSAHMANLCHQGVIEVEDSLNAVLNFTNGIRGTLFCTTCASVSRQVLLEVYTEAGTLSIYPDMAVLDGKAQFKSSDNTAGKKEWGSGHLALIREFYSDIISGRPTRQGLMSTIDTMDTMYAIYRSARTGEQTQV